MNEPVINARPPLHQAQEQAWSARAEHYANSTFFKQGPDLDKLLQLARPTFSDDCLDIGTGTGHTAAALARSGARSVLGLDASEAMLREAITLYGELPNLAFTQGSADDTDQLANSFDLITVRHAAHHFPSISGFLAEAMRILRPGGRLVILDEITPNEDVDGWFDALERMRDPSHVRAYLMREWQTFITNSGFVWICGDTRTQLPFSVEAWMARAELDKEEREDVLEHFHIATPKERTSFNVKFKGREAISFSMFFALMLLVKPST